MNVYSLIAEGVQRELQGEKIFGVVVGVVTNNKDDDGLGRVKVTFPWLAEGEESHWARLASFMAGGQRGAFFLPEVDDEVLVAFEHGDINRPYVIGALWNGVDKPPQDNGDGKNHIRLLKSRSGHEIILDDTDNAEKIAIKDKSGNNSVVWDTANNTITIAADQDIVLKAAQGKITVKGTEIEIKASGSATIEAAGELTLKGATVNIN